MTVIPFIGGVIFSGSALFCVAVSLRQTWRGYQWDGLIALVMAFAFGAVAYGLFMVPFP